MLKKRGVNNVRLSLLTHCTGWVVISHRHRDATRRALPRNGRHNSLHTAEPLYSQKAPTKSNAATLD